MSFDIWSLYARMLESRLFEEAVARLCTRTTIPHARHLEDQILPNTQRICDSSRKLVLS